MLREPAPSDWLSWRRTLDGQGHSPLDQIDTENVDQLRLAWSWSLGPGSQQTTPLVHDGVLYIANPGEIVQALDATYGDFLWEYRRDAPEPGNSFGGPPPGRQHRNIAIYEDKVYLNTADAHIIAIDARTGEAVWDTDVGRGVGFQYSSGSIVADGQGGVRADRLRPLPRRHLLHRGARRADRRRVVGAPPPSPCPASGAATRGATCRSCSGPAATRGFPGQLRPGHPAPCSTARRRPSRGRGWCAAPTATPSTPTRPLALDPDTGEMKWYFQQHPGRNARHGRDPSSGSWSTTTGKRSGRSRWARWRCSGSSTESKTRRSFPQRATTSATRPSPTSIPRPARSPTGKACRSPSSYEEVFWCPSTGPASRAGGAMSYHPEDRGVVIPINPQLRDRPCSAPSSGSRGGGGTGPVPAHQPLPSGQPRPARRAAVDEHP